MFSRQLIGLLGSINICPVIPSEFNVGVIMFIVESYAIVTPDKKTKEYAIQQRLLIYNETKIYTT